MEFTVLAVVFCAGLIVGHWVGTSSERRAWIDGRRGPSGASTTHLDDWKGKNGWPGDDAQPGPSRPGQTMWD